MFMMLSTFYIFFWVWCFVQRRKHKRVWNTLKIPKLVCFTNVQLKTQNSASAIVHSCFSAAKETSLCEPAFLFLCGPLIAKTGCTLHCFHRQVAQRRNNGSPIHSICAAFQVGLSQTFSHSQKGPEEGATIWVQDMWSQLLCLFVQISHNYHGYERFLDLLFCKNIRRSLYFPGKWNVLKGRGIQLGSPSWPHQALGHVGQVECRSLVNLKPRAVKPQRPALREISGWSSTLLPWTSPKVIQKGGWRKCCWLASKVP